MFEIQGIDVAAEIAQVLAECGEIVYMNHIEHWSPELLHKIMSGHFERLAEKLKVIDFTKCTQDELRAIGFRRWSEESNLMLIPLWLYDSLPDKLELVSIIGSMHIKGEYPRSNDPRGGVGEVGIVVAP